MDIFFKINTYFLIVHSDLLVIYEKTRFLSLLIRKRLKSYFAMSLDVSKDCYIVEQFRIES